MITASAGLRNACSAIRPGLFLLHLRTEKDIHLLQTLSPELQLLIALCKYPQDPTTSATISAMAARDIDWAAFETLVERHRVTGLVSANIKHAAAYLPDDTRDRLSSAARHHATSELHFAAETARLQEVFDRAGVPALFLKGVTIGMLAYGRLGLKRSWDIDLLTSPESIISALRLLEAEGYVLVPPFDMSESEILRFAGKAHELLLVNAAGISVELHWRMSQPHVLAHSNPFVETQTVMLAGRAVRTLRDDLLFAFLTVHGQAHGWSRIKWLADLAAFLGRRDAAEVGRLYDAAHALGTGRSAAVGLLLCADLFGLALSREVRDRCEADKVVPSLIKIDLACIAHPISGDLPLFSREYFGLVWAGLRREPGWRNFAAELKSRWTEPFTHARYPTWHHVLRLPFWLARTVRRVTHDPHSGGDRTPS